MNCFLVAEDDGLTLIDSTTSLADDGARLSTELGLDLKRVALTHAHGVSSARSTGSRIGCCAQAIGLDRSRWSRRPGIRPDMSPFSTCATAA
jgi:hypothetical protein